MDANVTALHHAMTAYNLEQVKHVYNDTAMHGSSALLEDMQKAILQFLLHAQTPSNKPLLHWYIEELECGVPPEFLQYFATSVVKSGGTSLALLTRIFGAFPWSATICKSIRVQLMGVSEEVEPQLLHHVFSQLKSPLDEYTLASVTQPGVLRALGEYPHLLAGVDATQALSNAVHKGRLESTRLLLRMSRAAPNINAVDFARILQINRVDYSKRAAACLALLLRDDRIDAAVAAGHWVPDSNGSMRALVKGDFWTGLGAREFAEQRDCCGRSLLFYACQYAPLDTLQEVLRQCRPNPYTRCKAGFSALQYCFGPSASEKRALLERYSAVTPDSIWRFFPESVRAQVLCILCCGKHLDLGRDVTWMIARRFAERVASAGVPEVAPPIDTLLALRYPGVEIRDTRAHELRFKWVVALIGFHDVVVKARLTEGNSGTAQYSSQVKHAELRLTLELAGAGKVEPLTLKQRKSFPHRSEEFRFPPSAVQMWDYAYQVNLRHVSFAVVRVVLAGALKNPPSECPLALLPLELLRVILRRHCARFWPAVLPRRPSVFWNISMAQDGRMGCCWRDDCVYLTAEGRLCHRVPLHDFIARFQGALRRMPLEAAARAESQARHALVLCTEPGVDHAK